MKLRRWVLLFMQNQTPSYDLPSLVAYCSFLGARQSSMSREKVTDLYKTIERKIAVMR